MAKSHEWEFQIKGIIWILIVILGKSYCRSSQTYFMSGPECGKTILLGGAVVYSHLVNVSKLYKDNVNCGLHFKTQNRDWKIMLQVQEMNIPDRQPDNGICNDALYVSDSNNVYKLMSEAGGNNGLCGDKLPSAIYSSGQYLTVHFRTDNSTKPPSHSDDIEKNWQGFKFIITAFSDDYDTIQQSCGSSFLCDNHKCIDSDLTCDRVDHCGDYSDESAEGPTKCGVSDQNIFKKFLSFGVAASVGIIVGGLIVCICCTTAIVYCCKNSLCKKTSATTNAGEASGTAIVMTTGGLGSFHGSHHRSALVSHHGSHHGNGNVLTDRGLTFHHPITTYTNSNGQGYYAMLPVYPSPQGSVYSAHTQNTVFTRDSGFTHNQTGYSSSIYSSQAPSYHRSHTPTSSKSGKSQHSNNSVIYNADKVTLPVNL